MAWLLEEHPVLKMLSYYKKYFFSFLTLWVLLLALKSIFSIRNKIELLAKSCYMANLDENSSLNWWDSIFCKILFRKLELIKMTVIGEILNLGQIFIRMKFWTFWLISEMIRTIKNWVNFYLFQQNFKPPPWEFLLIYYKESSIQ